MPFVAVPNIYDIAFFLIYSQDIYVVAHTLSFGSEIIVKHIGKINILY